MKDIQRSDQTLYEPILQDRILAILEDWDLSEREEEQLTYLSDELNRMHYDSEVWTSDVYRILTQVDAPNCPINLNDLVVLLWDC